MAFLFVTLSKLFQMKLLNFWNLIILINSQFHNLSAITANHFITEIFFCQFQKLFDLLAHLSEFLSWKAEYFHFLSS